MEDWMDIYLNHGTGRMLMNVEVIKRNAHTVIVRLEDGHIIKRKFKRDCK
jgi:hypothetical protein